MAILKAFGFGVAVYVLGVGFFDINKDIFFVVSLALMVPAYFYFKMGLKAVEPMARIAGSATAKAEKATSGVMKAFKEGRESKKEE